jgi:hypothetical protein
MLNRMFKCAAMLALLTVSVVSAKNYSFTTTEPVQAGNVELRPDAYTLRVQGSQVVLINSAGHEIGVSATVETAGQKFSDTAILTSKTDGANRLQSIELGGSSSRIVFQ